MSITVWHPVSLGAVNLREVLRYAGAKSESPEITDLITACLKEFEDILCPRVCYDVFSVEEMEGSLHFGFAEITSETLKKTLTGCQKALIFAATLGLEPDRCISRAEVTSPAKALILQAIGAERIEALCDKFQLDLKELGAPTRPRVSPGYGDIPLTFQTDIFRALNPEKHIGLTLTEAMLMVPSKSVTAIAGFIQ